MLSRYRGGRVPVAEADPAVTADFDGVAEEVGGLLDRAELTQALDVVWQRVRRLNRYVEEREPWKLAKDPEREADLDETLYTLAEGLRVVTVLLEPYLPEAAEQLLAALGEGEDAARLEHARLGARGGGAETTSLAPLFPKL
jgi:methionyl-tRNA synthetase